MSGTNWIVLIGVVLLLIIGVWYYTGDDGAAIETTEPAAVEAPAVDTAEPAADPVEPAEEPEADTTAN